MKETKISWTNATWNPVRGCSRVSEGCRNCYAEYMAARFSDVGQPYFGFAKMTAAGPRWTGAVKVVDNHLHDPLKWKKPKKIFVNSMSDLFHEDLKFSDILKVFRVMDKAKQHTFQVLTKRHKLMRKFALCLARQGNGALSFSAVKGVHRPVLSNVWLGVSAENQATLDERIHCLIETPAAIRFLSVEPMIGPVSIAKHLPKNNPSPIHWVIAGAESGRGRRKMKDSWVKKLKDECVQFGIPFFYKQMINESGKKVENPMLDGKRWVEYPDGGGESKAHKNILI